MLEDYKQVILVRDDLKLPKGKLAVQVAHASVEAVHRSNKSVVNAWRAEGMKKVVLKITNLDELYMYDQNAKKAGLVTAIITDAGRTVVSPGTVTCMAIGPDVEQKIDAITSKLKML
ncbi:MAG: peptidyl-tRNA hydrolase Pth2 [Candidatus Woesearchaeota archaeon]